MRITLVQPKQNRLYDFSGTERAVTAEESARGAAEMVAQTFDLMERAPRTDLLVTSEAVNFPGLEKRLAGRYADCVRSAPLIERFSAYARRRGCYVVASLYVERGGGLYNEAVTFDRAGAVVARYDKVHLAGDEQASLLPGDAYCCVDADFGRFGVCVCWDMQFPEVCRHYALSGARLVVCPTWGWESVYAHARAYENGIFVAGAMSVPYRSPIEGIRTPSEVVAPDGSVLARASASEAQSLTCEIDLSRGCDLHALRMRDRRPQTYGRLTDA